MDSQLPEGIFVFFKGWKLMYSKSHIGKPYYYNSLTGQSSWDPPTYMSDSYHIYHILIKHKNSRRPFSWRNEPIGMSYEEAYKEIEALRSSLLACNSLFEEFKTTATVRSDCSSASRQGDLGYIKKGQMQGSETYI